MTDGWRWKQRENFGAGNKRRGKCYKNNNARVHFFFFFFRTNYSTNELNLNNTIFFSVLILVLTDNIEDNTDWVFQESRLIFRVSRYRLDSGADGKRKKIKRVRARKF